MAIIEFTVVKVETIQQSTITTLLIEDSTISMTENMINMHTAQTTKHLVSK